jgi:hypothetical protein
MMESKYERYFLNNPKHLGIGELAYHDKIKERNAEGLVYLSSEIIPETEVYSVMNRSWGVPNPQPYIQAHTHDVDELIYFLALNPDGILGADVEIDMGDEAEKHIVKHNSLIFVPKGLKHGPIYYWNFQEGRQFYMVVVLLKPSYG